MNEIDLIPNDYRHKQKSKQIVWHFGIFLTIVLLILGTGKFFLKLESSKVNQKISVLQKEEQLLNEEEKLIFELKSDRFTVINRLAFVDMLDKGDSVSRIFLMFDKALDKTVWLDNWQYTGGDLMAEEEADTTMMKVSVSGHAVDHEALSRFVERLMSQAEVENVKVIKSTMANKEDTISFDMEII